MTGFSLIDDYAKDPSDLAGTLTGLQGDIGCRVLAALSTVK